MDQIKIIDLEVFANHGVFPEETALGQKFLVNCMMDVETRAAGRSDDLTQSVHYGEVSHAIHIFLKEHTYKLIETAAEKLAEHLLLTFGLIRSVQIELKKPWAPIGLPFSSVSVAITRGWHTAYIAFGSNMGDREAYIGQAVDKLNGRADCQVMTVSDKFYTKPYGGVEQDDFVNGCLELRTLLTPDELLQELNLIEAEADRVRDVRWGPRTLDLDILFYDDLVYDSANLQIPHIDLHNRSFVLDPMNQIAPWLRHPVKNKTIRELKGELDHGLTADKSGN